MCRAASFLGPVPGARAWKGGVHLQATKNRAGRHPLAVARAQVRHTRAHGMDTFVRNIHLMSSPMGVEMTAPGPLPQKRFTVVVFPYVAHQFNAESVSPDPLPP